MAASYAEDEVRAINDSQVATPTDPDAAGCLVRGRRLMLAAGAKLPRSDWPGAAVAEREATGRPCHVPRFRVMYLRFALSMLRASDVFAPCSMLIRTVTFKTRELCLEKREGWARTCLVQDECSVLLRSEHMFRRRPSGHKLDAKRCPCVSNDTTERRVARLADR
ncbi:hypothetical protein BDY21DRAFT_4377 [Lineolata rhizophorae]|uniref:Uncharacterized protein n=1 Tax=Lineolata rhizophorae TaxID=578093 RepID=A0A6A6PDB9_9PEZI|nr:hypothetical protein BDY21DRAFT_4377 [Lineolata rhizophorae]